MTQVWLHLSRAVCILALISLNSCATVAEEKLRIAAAEGNLLRVDTFLAQGVNVSAANERGLTPLHMAAKHGHRDAVRLLLGKGAAINPVSQDGITPLFSAVQQGHRDIVAILLDNGVDVNTQPSVGGVTLLHVAAYRGDQEIITLLLNHGGNKYARMSSGERPVDLAEKRGHAVLIPLLQP